MRQSRHSWLRLATTATRAGRRGRRWQERISGSTQHHNCITIEHAIETKKKKKKKKKSTRPHATQERGNSHSYEGRGRPAWAECERLPARPVCCHRCQRCFQVRPQTIPRLNPPGFPRRRWRHWQVAAWTRTGPPAGVAVRAHAESLARAAARLPDCPMMHWSKPGVRQPHRRPGAPVASMQSAPCRSSYSPPTPCFRQQTGEDFQPKTEPDGRLIPSVLLWICYFFSHERFRGIRLSSSETSLRKINNQSGDRRHPHLLAPPHSSGLATAERDAAHRSDR